MKVHLKIAQTCESAKEQESKSVFKKDGSVHREDNGQNLRKKCLPYFIGIQNKWRIHICEVVCKELSKLILPTNQTVTGSSQRSTGEF